MPLPRWAQRHFAALDKEIAETRAFFERLERTGMVPRERGKPRPVHLSGMGTSPEPSGDDGAVAGVAA
jgi:hypothetical protein